LEVTFIVEPISGTLTAALATLRVAKAAAKKLKNTELSEKLKEVYEEIHSSSLASLARRC
jgi:hypothetical protein